MIKVLSLAAALAVLPVSAAVADPQKGPSERAIEAAAGTFEARMEAFGARAEAIAGDASLSGAQRETRIAALWTEYQPDLTAFTSVVTRHASAIAAQVLAEIDVEAVVTEALAGVEVSGALQAAQGMAANGAWASNDPEHMTTYGLMADYALGTALDSVEAAQGEIEAVLDDTVTEALEAGHEHRHPAPDED
jgi:hypothetical protein